MNSQLKRCIGHSPERSSTQEFLFLWSWGTLPFQHMGVFTDLKALGISLVKSCYSQALVAHAL
jgi:hypothetical protein